MTKPVARHRFTKYPADVSTLAWIYQRMAPGPTGVVTGPLYRRAGRIYVSLSTRKPASGPFNEVFKVWAKDERGYMYVGVTSGTWLEAMLQASFRRDGRNYYPQVLLHYVVPYLAGSAIGPGLEVHHNNGNHQDNRNANLSFPPGDVHDEFHVRAAPRRPGAQRGWPLPGADRRVWWLNVVYLDRENERVKNLDPIGLFHRPGVRPFNQNKRRHLAQVLDVVLHADQDRIRSGFRVADADRWKISLSARTIRDLLKTLEVLGLVDRWDGTYQPTELAMRWSTRKDAAPFGTCQTLYG